MQTYDVEVENVAQQIRKLKLFDPLMRVISPHLCHKMQSTAYFIAIALAQRGGVESSDQRLFVDEGRKLTLLQCLLMSITYCQIDILLQAVQCTHTCIAGRNQSTEGKAQLIRLTYTELGQLSHSNDAIA